jgi:hypothetical protein
MEIWKDIQGWEGKYRVSNSGKVRSLARTAPGLHGSTINICERLLKLWIHRDGYSIATLQGKKHYRVHRLVANAFIPNPENKRTVNHKNGIKTDNNVENLEWATHSENHKHAYRLGLHPKRFGEKASRAKIKDYQRPEIVRLQHQGVSIREIGRKYNISHGAVRAILKTHDIS